MPLFYYQTPLASSLMDIVLDEEPATKIPRKEQLKPWFVDVDVAGYQPEDLKLRLDGQELVLEGAQEENKDGSTFSRSFSRKWRLPRNLDLQGMQTQLDGTKLKISAPRKPNSVEFPINVVTKKTEKDKKTPEKPVDLTLD